jgi:adenosylmethionine-8-amino-7-oxononanoate aminotransferase
VLRRAQDNGLLFRAVRDSLCLCPPLVIREAEIEDLIERLARSLDEAAREIAAA